MTPEFSSLVNPFIDDVLELVERLKRGESANLEQERTKLEKLLRETRVTSEAMSPPLAKEFEVAQQTLVYWADEVLTEATQNRPHDSLGTHWSEYTLEWQFYKEQERAWKFYVHAEQQAKHSRSDVLEVVFLGMVLGFEGEITDGWSHLGRSYPKGLDPTRRRINEAERKKFDSELRQFWANEIYEVIRHSSPGQTAIPDGPPLQGDTEPLKGSSYLSTAMFVLLACVIVFVILAVRQFYGERSEGEKSSPQSAMLSNADATSATTC